MTNHIKIILRFISSNQSKFIILLLSVAALDYIAKFPYFNTFLLFPYPWNSLIILWIITAILFRLGEAFSFGTAFVLLCMIMILSVFGRNNLAETLGNGVYGLLLLGYIEMIVHHIVHHKE